MRELLRWNASLEEPGEFHTGEWIHFTDDNGRGCAQPDIFLVFPTLILVIECKLSQTDNAKNQLLDLYKPLLEHLFHRPAFCIQACKNLYAWPEQKILHPETLLNAPRPGMHTWHYL